MLYQKILVGTGLIVAVAAAIYVVSALHKYFAQSAYVYSSKREVAANPFDLKLYFEEVILKTSDGINLCGWFIPSRNSRKVMLFLHGNGGNISSRLTLIDYFNRRVGLSVFIIDYRGYGKSEGRITEAGTYLDARAAWDYLTVSKKIKPEDIIIYGRSLGGPIAARLAGEVDAKLLILDSTFTSIKDIAAEMYPYLPVRRFFKYDYPTLSYIKSVKCPLMVIHSSGDDHVPFSHALKLYDIAKEPKQFLKISGTHSKNYVKSREAYIEGVKSFILKYGKN
ncbi:MAG: alpha/beta hydrolase [Actinomycetota bacterium]|nr:alpha/beta hydrolase [Actinomycetota bacterium]